MAIGDVDFQFRWPVGDSSQTGDTAVVIHGRWACCDDPEHAEVDGFFILTPIKGCTWADLINQMAKNDISVISMWRTPHYLDLDLRQQAEEA